MSRRATLRPPTADRRTALAWWRSAFGVATAADRRIAIRPLRDPRRLLAWLDYHRMRSLSAAGAGRCGHPAAALVAGAEQLRAAQRLRLVAESAVVHRALAAAGIAHRFLKGPACAFDYPAPAWRDPSTDIDVAVPPEAVEAAVAALTAAGWRPSVDAELLAWATRRYFACDLAPAGERALWIDLHWRFDVRGRAGAEVLGAAFAGVEHAPLAGLALPVAPVTERLRHSLIHGSRSGWSRLRYVADVAAWLHRHRALATPLPETPGQAMGLLLASRWLRAPLAPQSARAVAASLRRGGLAPVRRRQRLAWARAPRREQAIERLESVRWQGERRQRLAALAAPTLRDIAALPPVLRRGAWPLLLRPLRLTAQRAGLLPYD